MDIHHIKLLGKVFSYDDYRNDSPAVHALLTAAHEKERAYCLCSVDRPELVVRRRLGTYFLAKMPHTGARHDGSCPFFELPEELTGAVGYDSQAIVETEEGFRLRFALPLSVSRLPASTSTGEAVRQPGTTIGMKRSALGLQGLLHFLWQHSRNATWYSVIKAAPVKDRTWSKVAYYLSAFAGETEINGKSLSESLYVVPTYRSFRRASIASEAKAAFEEVIGSSRPEAVAAGEPQQFKLVLGEVKHIEPSRYGYKLQLRHFAAPVYFSQKTLADLEREYPDIMSMCQSGSDGNGPIRRIIALLRVHASAHGDLVADDIAPMMTNHAYIPVTDEKDAAIADMLVAAGRRFEKPLPYDGQTLTLPDYTLLDCAEHRRVNILLRHAPGDQRSVAATDESATWIWDGRHAMTAVDLPEGLPALHHTGVS